MFLNIFEKLELTKSNRRMYLREKGTDRERTLSSVGTYFVCLIEVLILPIESHRLSERNMPDGIFV